MKICVSMPVVVVLPCVPDTQMAFLYSRMITPQACARSNTGMPWRAGRGDLGIVVVGGGRADDAVRALDILGAVADVHFDALGDQLVGGDGGVHVRAGDRDAHAAQHQPSGRMETPPMPIRWMCLPGTR